jgi:hypothetical protein
MVIDGREICNMEELRDFCNSVIAQAKVHPSTIVMAKPVCMRVIERGDSRKSYDVETTF